MVSLGRGLKYNKFKMTSQPSNVILVSESDLDYYFGLTLKLITLGRKSLDKTHS